MLDEANLGKCLIILLLSTISQILIFIGDPYVIDVGRNKGHVGPLTSGTWHPKIKDEYLTASTDNSLRIWLAEEKGRKSKAVIKTKSKKSGLKTVPTACNYSRDGLLVAATCQDGSIQMWDHR